MDASHSFAHIDYKIPDLDCDYYATSLHKWLCAPFGTGFMYIKKDKIDKVWALLSAPVPDAGNIGKFESLGTRSFAAEMAIGNACDFQDMVGNQRKEERLRYLKNYWVRKAQEIKGFKLYTSLKADYSCAIASFNLEGWEPGDVSAALFEKKKIHTTSMNHEKLHCVRVTPHVYTSIADLDTLLEGIREIAASEPPKKKE